MSISTYLGIVGGLSGLASLAVSISARFEAVKSNRIARESLDDGKNANKLAAESNYIARSAHRLAVEANEFSTRGERRELEQNLVAWALTFPGDAVVRVTNTGRDDALEVFASCSVGEENIQRAAKILRPGDFLDFQHDELLLLLQNDWDQFALKKDSINMKLSHISIGNSIAPPQPRELDVVVTIKWQTPLGAEKEKIISDRRHQFVRTELEKG